MRRGRAWNPRRGACESRSRAQAAGAAPCSWRPSASLRRSTRYGLSIEPGPHSMSALDTHSSDHRAQSRRCRCPRHGAVDATPLFVVLLGMYVERTGDEATLRALWPAAERALGWMDTSGDIGGDGFLEYPGTSGEGPRQGLRNQGWKNSFDAVFHSDGQLAEGPIALCEVQAYAYAAKRLASRCASRLGHDDKARKLTKTRHRIAGRNWRAVITPSRPNVVEYQGIPA